MQKHSILDAWRGSEYACVQTAPGNILCHQNNHLMGYSEFLLGSRIICLPLRISEKLHWQHVFEKLEEAETDPLHLYQHDTWYNTHAPWRVTSINQTNGNHHHFSFGYESCTWPRSGPFCWQNPCSSFNRENLILLFLNIISFNFVPTPNKSLKLGSHRAILFWR